ncbi:hypothetical protein N7G274_005112 [Stereocaulon virgatum]|uniref:Uncharacterized protein n=1 Tax=Stereocaulon virgatum TaxID=373712 RepID=A0ABR4A7N6_9LECA
MMDNFFMEVKESTGVELQVSYNQWQTRKRAWDEEWSIKEKTGLSPKARCELDKLPLWFDSKNGVITHRYLELGKSSWFEQPTKVKALSQTSELPEFWYQPDQRDMDETWNNDVPVYGSISDSTNPYLGYTDAPQIAPFFNYGTTLDPKQSPYDLHQPVEQAPTKYERQALAPYGVPGHYNTASVPAEGVENHPHIGRFDGCQVSGFEHHTTVFNEQVLHCDALKAVELKQSSHLEAGRNGTDASGLDQAPRSNPPQLLMEANPVSHATLNDRDLVPYGERH